MVNRLKTVFMPLTVGAVFAALNGCGKVEGACEFAYDDADGSSNYYCEDVSEEYAVAKPSNGDVCFSGDRRHLHKDSSCGSIGYDQPAQYMENSYVYNDNYDPSPYSALIEGSGSGGGSTGSDLDAMDGSTYDYTFTCGYGSDYTVPITNGPCESSQKTYSEVFGCNDVANFASACYDFYGCVVDNSTGVYKEQYQQHLDACSTY